MFWDHRKRRAHLLVALEAAKGLLEAVDAAGDPDDYDDDESERLSQLHEWAFTVWEYLNVEADDAITDEIEGH